MRRLKIRPEEGIAIEDSVSGAQAALRAGLSVIGMEGTIPVRTLRRTGVFASIGRLTDLLPYATHL
jgi:beta-phosphoglucomutase-like phosphatase (HAD superfamily)